MIKLLVMKKYTKSLSLFIAASCVVLLSSCYIEDPGSLRETEQNYDVDDFDRLNMGDAFIIDVKHADYFSIQAKGDVRNIDDLDVYKKGGTLHVKYDDDHGRKHDTYITITMPYLTAVKFSGASDSHISGFSGGDKLNINLSGASTSTLDVDVDQVDIDLSGASHLRGSGITTMLNAEISGASVLSAFNLEAENAWVRVSGASDAKVNVISTLDAKASGASKIIYRGSPQVTRDASGASSIRQD
jgi:hypothetical protein